MAGPLAGLKVIEIVGIGPAPYAAMLLADLGAEVVRVDRAGGGMLRGSGGPFDFLGRNVGPLTLHTYGVLLAIAFLVGLWVAARQARRAGLDAAPSGTRRDAPGPPPGVEWSPPRPWPGAAPRGDRRPHAVSRVRREGQDGEGPEPNPHQHTAAQP